MTQEERSDLRHKLRDKSIIRAANEVLANLPMAGEDPSKPINAEMAAAKYYYHAGALAGFNALFRLGYSLQEFGDVHQKVKVPQFKPEKPL